MILSLNKLYVSNACCTRGPSTIRDRRAGSGLMREEGNPTKSERPLPVTPPIECIIHIRIGMSTCMYSNEVTLEEEEEEMETVCLLHL